MIKVYKAKFTYRAMSYVLKIRIKIEYKLIADRHFFKKLTRGEKTHGIDMND